MNKPKYIYFLVNPHTVKDLLFFVLFLWVYEALYSLETEMKGPRNP